MISEFFLVKVKEIAEIYSGNSINEKVKVTRYTGLEAGIDYISTKDINFDSTINYSNGVKIPYEELKNFKRAPKDTVFICAEGGSAGRKVAISDRELCFVNKLFAVVARDSVLPKYLYYYFKSEGFIEQFKGSMTGIIGGVSINKFKELYVRIPPLATQQKIVAKLDAIFAEIDKVTAASEANIKNSDLFVRGAIENLIRRFSSDCFVKFGDICYFVRGPFGGSLKKSIFVDKGYAVYEQQHPINNQFDSFRYFIDEKKFNEMKRFEVFHHDLLMSCSGVTLGKIAIVPKNSPKGIINQALLKITPKSGVSKDYLKIVMESDYFQSILWDVSGGAAQPNVPSVKVIKDFLIPMPSVEEQEKFVDIVSSIRSYDLKSIYSEKKISLIDFKNSVLRKAFAGELVKE